MTITANACRASFAALLATGALAMAAPASATLDVAFTALDRVRGEHIMVVHDGDDAAFEALDATSADRLRDAIAAKALGSGESATLVLDGLDTDVSTPAAHVALGAKLGGYTHTRYKSDLSGAAAVGGAVLAAAKRGADIDLVAVMPLAENMPAEDAIRPGDVLTTYNGTTIEVMSTDAEGRLLLADAVAYAQDEFDPELVVNIATLTGSAARALGDEYGAVITRDFDLATRMMEIGEAAGEAVWPLPLHPNHYEQIESEIADIKSTAGSPGASIGAAVVGTFVDEDQPWVHLDIAGVDWRDSATPTAPKGHAGWGVRFLDQLMRDLEQR